MHIRSTVHPNQRGAKKLRLLYGDRLVCVRYRYDAQRQKRIKTVELIVAEEAWTAPPPPPQKNDVVHIALTVHEVPLRQQVKQRGGRWNPQRGLWELRYDQVLALGLQARIVDTKGTSGL
jgi:hypothetical protein